ncbi:MAG: hypothetical protein IPP72_14805 [Chitinophagaceae bacterium]|nr:hypothetical protein [Chitinophagaceae bacterium]
MRRKITLLKWLMAASFILLVVQLQAQPPVKTYTIKDGNMYIALSKNLQQSSLDSFISKYELSDLNLPAFLQTGIADSLHKLGWKVDIDSKEIFVISKPLFSADNITDPADKIIFTQKEGTDVLPPANQVHFGYNRYKNKSPFAVSDSVVTFFLRGNTGANSVKLAGSFTNWQHAAFPMARTDSGWIANVKLPAGKHLYKFIIDGNWTVDRDDINNENDGMGNDNSVYYKTNYNFTLDGYSNAKKVYLAGSFNGWRANELQMIRTATGCAIPVYLSEGTHTYRFIADGNWFADPANNDKLPNEYNGFNSVIRIGKPYTFKLNGFAGAQKVVLFGSFNNWKENELFMNKTGNGWELPYTLGPGNYEYKLIIDGKYFGDSVLSGNLALVIQPNFTFRLKGFANASTVCLGGDMNNWNPTSFKMKREGDDWIFKAHLNKGKHVYKFIIDGKWILDPANKLWEENEYNTKNSVLWIESD